MNNGGDPRNLYSTVLTCNGIVNTPSKVLLQQTLLSRLSAFYSFSLVQSDFSENHTTIMSRYLALCQTSKHDYRQPFY